MSDSEEDIKEGVEEINLPSGYIYSKFTKYRDDEKQFRCNDIKTDAEIQKWVKKFGEQNYVEWRIARTYPHMQGIKCCYRIDYRCQHGGTRRHQIKPSSVRGTKSVQCPTQLIIKRMRRSKYDMAETFTLIQLKNQHNHDTGTTANSLRYRDVGEKTKERLLKLFSHGHSASTAYYTLQSDALMHFGKDYSRIAADRNQIPDLSYCYNIFYKEFKKVNGSVRGNDKVDYKKLELNLDEWCRETGGTASLELFEDNVIISILTPLMKRVHLEVAESSHLLYLEASINFEQSKSKTYLLYTHSIAGGLPLGYIITSSGREDIFERALKQFCMLDEDGSGFSGRGIAAGPENIITGNDLHEFNSLESIWPGSNLLLSPVHVLRTVWRWISDSKQGVDKSNRINLFLFFKNILTAASCDDVMKKYEEMKASQTVLKYPTFMNYIDTSWWPLKMLWCICFRPKSLTKNDQTNTYMKCGIRIVQDIFLKQTKGYNIAQVVDLILSRFDEYYSQRIADLLTDKFSVSQLKQCLSICEDISPESITMMKNDNFLIQIVGNEVYIVDIKLGICTCSKGISGALCEHQCAIMLHNLENTSSSLPKLSSDIHKWLYYIATGNQTFTNKFDEDSDGNSTPSDKLEGRQEDDWQMQEQKISTSDHDPVYEHLKNVFDDILDRVQCSSSLEMTKASRTFCKNYYMLCKDNNALQCALSTFGKNRSQVNLNSSEKVDKDVMSKSRRKIALQQKNLNSSKSPVMDKNMLTDQEERDAVTTEDAEIIVLELID